MANFTYLEVSLCGVLFGVRQEMRDVTWHGRCGLDKLVGLAFQILILLGSVD